METLLHHVDLSHCSDEMVTLSEDSRETGIYERTLHDCCNGLLTGDSGAENPDFLYV